jgi:serine O-acetyltransferase
MGTVLLVSALLPTLRADYAGFLELDADQTRSLLRRRLDVLTLPGMWAVAMYRVSSTLHRIGLTPLARLLMVANIVCFSCELSPRLSAGPGLVIPHPQGVAVGAGVTLGARVRLMRGVGIGTAGYRDKRRDGFSTIGDDCVLFDGVKVFGPVNIGERSTIGTNVVLFDSVPPDSVVVVHQDVEVRRAGAHKQTA